MTNYSQLANNAIDYIEDNITKRMSIDDLAFHFHTSSFHFNRIFTFMTGISAKQYMLGRKLTKSLSDLIAPEKTVTNIAFDYGFEYPEVYSRAFKNWFGISPNTYRTTTPTVKQLQKAHVITRDVVSFKGSLTLKSDYVFLDKYIAYGYHANVDFRKKDALETLDHLVKSFIIDTKDISDLEKDKITQFVQCTNNANEFSCYIYKEEIGKVPDIHLSRLPKLIRRDFSPSWYVKFTYHGDLSKIHSSFESDILRWLKQKKEKLEVVEPGLFILFDPNLINTPNAPIYLLIRVHRKL